MGGLTSGGFNTLDSIQLLNDPSNPVPVGVSVANAQDITIKRSIIGGLNDANGYTTALNLSQAQNVNVAESELNAFSTADMSGGGTVFGIVAMNSANINVNLSAINVTNVVTGDGAAASTLGLLVLNNSGINLKNTFLFDTASVNGNSMASASDTLFLAQSQSAINFTGVASSLTAFGGDSPGLVSGALVFSNVSSIVNYKGTLISTVNVSGTNLDTSGGAGNTLLVASNASIINSAGNIFNNNTVNGSASTFTSLALATSTSDALKNSVVNQTGNIYNTIIANGNNLNLSLTDLIASGTNGHLVFTGNLFDTIQATGPNTNVSTFTFFDVLPGSLQFTGRVQSNINVVGDNSNVSTQLAFAQLLTNPSAPSVLYFKGAADLFGTVTGANASIITSGVTANEGALVAVDKSIIKLGAQAFGPGSAASSEGISIDQTAGPAGVIGISGSRFFMNALGDGSSSSFAIANNSLPSIASINLLDSNFVMHASGSTPVAQILASPGFIFNSANTKFLCNGAFCTM